MKQGWEIKKLGDITTSINGLWTGKKPPFITVAVIRNTNFTKDCKLDTSDIAYIDVEVKQYASRKLQCGDIIIEKSGGSDKQPVGRPILFNIEEGEYSFSNFTSTLRVNDRTTILPEFIHRYLAYIYMRGDTAAMQSKTTGIRNLDFTLYKSIHVPVPPREEQERIVEELDCLSGVIEKKREQLRELDALAQSIFYQMFGDPITNEKGWEIDRLGNMCEISSSKRIYAHEYCEDGIPFYRGKEITEKSKGNDISVELYIAEDRYHELKRKFGVPQKGDILITAVGTIGNIWVVDSDTPFYFKDGNVLWLHIKDNINPIYFKTLLYNLIDKYKESMANGCAYSALTIVNLKEMQTNKIPFVLQQQFAEKIEKIEQHKKLISQSIKETEDLFNARMAYYFN